MTSTLIAVILGFISSMIGHYIQFYKRGRDKQRIKELEHDIKVLKAQLDVKPHRSYDDVRKWLRDETKK